MKPTNPIMLKPHLVTTEDLDLNTVQNLIEHHSPLKLSAEVEKKITRCREYLEKKIAGSDTPIYGINTGFGSLQNRSVSKNDLGRLQRNLVLSHACGTGNEVPEEIVRLMLFLKIQSLSYGHSGVQLSTVNRLVTFYNAGVMPVVYEYGSLGASGDLAPLAHLSIPLLGEGEVRVGGEKLPAGKVLQKLGLKPLELQAKEGLALLNGTQFMSAYGVHICLRVFKLSILADVISAISLDAYNGLPDPFHPLVQKLRPYKGQMLTARRILNILKGSKHMQEPRNHIQDPYSFRCIPQVHGASKDSIDYAAYVFEREINAVTDNPTIFPGEDLIISAGNFHGQPLALALDNLCIAMAELANISERRIYQLLSGNRGLPPFLAASPGLNSGFMIPQYTAAALVSHNKILSHPAAVDSIESSQGQEDHVSMGANAAIKAFQVLLNLERVLAIELFNAAQALEFRRPSTSSPWVEEFLLRYRKVVPYIDSDQLMYNHIENTIQFLQQVKINLPGEESGSNG